MCQNSQGNVKNITDKLLDIAYTLDIPNDISFLESGAIFMWTVSSKAGTKSFNNEHDARTFYNTLSLSRTLYKLGNETATVSEMTQVLHEAYINDGKVHTRIELCGFSTLEDVTLTDTDSGFTQKLTKGEIITGQIMSLSSNPNIYHIIIGHAMFSYVPRRLIKLHACAK